jgi:hypothetical protein
LLLQAAVAISSASAAAYDTNLITHSIQDASLTPKQSRHCRAGCNDIQEIEDTIVAQEWADLVVATDRGVWT